MLQNYEELWRIPDFPRRVLLGKKAKLPYRSFITRLFLLFILFSKKMYVVIWGLYQVKKGISPFKNIFLIMSITWTIWILEKLVF